MVQFVGLRRPTQKRAIASIIAVVVVATWASVAEAAISDGAACTSKGKIVGVQTKSGRTDFFTPTLSASWKPALAKVMNDWNTHAAGRGYVTYSPDEITNGVCASQTAPS